MVVVGDLDAGDGRAVPKPILQKTLMEPTVSREALKVEDGSRQIPFKHQGANAEATFTSANLTGMSI